MNRPRVRHKKVRVRVPATTSNLGPGFDVLGLALDLHNEVELEILPSFGADSVDISGEGENSLPRDRTNIALNAVRSRLPRQICPNALHLRLVNRIPLARGLGSSAAARLGGVLAAHALSSTPKELAHTSSALDMAYRLEGHPDNVVPALYGGLCAAIPTKEGVRYAPFDVPRDLRAVVCVPSFELSTQKARKVLPVRIARQDAVQTAARVAFLLYAISRREFRSLPFAMQDVLHQPYRRKLVPGMARVIESAVRAGAFGASLSGAGPSIFAFSPKGNRGTAIGRAMQRAFSRAGVRSRFLLLDIDRRGATSRILS